MQEFEEALEVCIIKDLKRIGLSDQKVWADKFSSLIWVSSIENSLFLINAFSPLSFSSQMAKNWVTNTQDALTRNYEFILSLLSGLSHG